MKIIITESQNYILRRMQQLNDIVEKQINLFKIKIILFNLLYSIFSSITSFNNCCDVIIISGDSFL